MPATRPAASATEATTSECCCLHLPRVRRVLRVVDRFFDTFVWPQHQRHNEGLADMTHPMTANAFHTVDANQPADVVFEQIHRVLARY